MSVPAICPYCGLAFISRGLRITDSTEVTVIGGGEDCPRCHRPARYVSGVYSFVGDAVAAFKALSFIEAHQLGEVARGVQSAGLTDAESSAAIAQATPQLAAIAEQARQRGWLKILLVLILILVARCTVTANFDVDVNELVDQVFQHPSYNADGDADETHRNQDDDGAEDPAGDAGVKDA